MWSAKTFSLDKTLIFTGFYNTKDLRNTGVMPELALELISPWRAFAKRAPLSLAYVMLLYFIILKPTTNHILLLITSKGELHNTSRILLKPISKPNWEIPGRKITIKGFWKSLLKISYSLICMLLLRRASFECIKE